MVLLWSGNSQKKYNKEKAQYEQNLNSTRTAMEDSVQFTQEATVVITAQQDSLSPLFPAMWIRTTSSLRPTRR